MQLNTLTYVTNSETVQFWNECFEVINTFINKKIGKGVTDIIDVEISCLLSICGTPLLIALIWLIWKEKNARCFEGKCAKVQASEKLKITVASWMLVLPDFKGSFVDQCLG